MTILVPRNTRPVRPYRASTCVHKGGPAICHQADQQCHQCNQCLQGGILVSFLANLIGSRRWSVTIEACFFQICFLDLLLESFFFMNLKDQVVKHICLSSTQGKCGSWLRVTDENLKDQACMPPSRGTSAVWGVFAEVVWGLPRSVWQR